MLCLKKRRTYSFTQGVCADLPRRSKKDNQRYEGSLNMAITTLPRKNRSREERPSRMVLTVTEDTPADMLAGSMELLVQLPRDHHLQTQRVTVQRSTPMMDLLVQITTAHKLAASSYTLQAIGERGLVLPHQPNTPIGALDALQVKLLPKQGTFVSRKVKQANQPFETTFRLQVHLPRNQLYVSRVSPKMNLGDILEEVCREKNLDKNKYELRHPANLEETLDLSLSLQDYHLQEVTLYAKQGRSLGSALSTQDIMALQRQEDRRRQQAKQGVFGFVFKKSKEGSLSTDSLGGRSASPARSDETGRSASPLQPPARPQRKRRPAPKPPISAQPGVAEENGSDSTKDKVVISHSRNSSDSSGYHEASVLSDNPDIAGRLPETLPRRGRAPMETARKLAQTAQSSKSLGNLATVSGTLARGISSTSLSSAGLRKKRTAPPPPVTRPLSSAISTQALERIVDSEESLTSDIDPSKPPSDIGAPSKANSDIDDPPKANSDIGVTTITTKTSSSIDLKTSVENNFEAKSDIQTHRSMNSQPFAAVMETNTSLEDPHSMVDARVTRKRAGEPVPLPKPRKTTMANSVTVPPRVPKRRLAPQSPSSRNTEFKVESLLNPATKTFNKIPNDGEVLDVAKDSPINHLEPDQEVLKNSKDEELIGESTKHEIEMLKLLQETKDKENSSGPECLVLESKKVSGNLDNDLLMVQNKDDINEQIIEEIKAPQVESPDESLEVSLNKEIIPQLNTSRVSSDRNLDISINNEITEEEIKTPPVISPRSSKVSQEQEITEEVRTLQTTSAKTEITKEDIKTPPVISPRRSKVSLEEEITKEVNIPQTTSIKNFEVSLNEEIIEDIKTSQVEPDQSMEVIRNEEIPEKIKTPRVTPNQRVLDSVSQEITSEVKIQQTASTQNLQHTEKLLEKGQEKAFSEAGKLAEPRHSVKEKSYCAVISTLPKCEHLDTLSDKTPNKFELSSNDKTKFPSKNSSKSNTPSPRRSMKSIKIDSLPHQIKSDTCEESATSWTDNSPKESRRKVLRSASKSNDFEINSLKRQKRHLTSHPEDITFAMNLNLSPNVDLLSGLSKEHGETQPEDESNQVIDSGSVNEEILHRERGIQDAELSETDILLQKVSDTLSNTLPNSSNIPVPSQKNVQVKPDVKKTTLKKEERKDSPDGTINVISPNITVTSQQDTSDYVSAMDDDLSIPEWEYQLPAPPSAFRDSASPVFDTYDTITVRSSDVMKESEVSGENKNSGTSDVSHVHNPTSSRTSEEISAEMKKEENGPKYLRHKQNSSLKKEVISELQNKIGSLPQPARESDKRIDNSSTPKIAPVDNTLSNFTITTYSRPKNVNIFEEVGQQTLDNTDERFVRSFATLSRSKNNHEEPEEKFGSEFKSGALLTMKKVSTGENFETIEDYRTVEPKMQSQQELHRWQTGNSGNEKITVQRSKSYISFSDKGKYQSVIGDSRNVGNDGNSSVERNENAINGAANFTGSNSGASRSNEKFSQWRENILKRQEEPTKEKQLQSLQVLKSILPQLKSAQQTEENVSKEYNGTVLHEKTRSETTSNEHSMESNATSARDSQTPSNFKQLDVESKKSETKRYIYSGPPAINLGSWSERPNANVQIKRDTDYKQSLNKVTNGRTIVNINGARDERDGYESKSDTSSARNYVKFEAKSEHTDRNSPDELTKKLISHTTASGFKKPTLNKVNVEMKTGDEKPIVTGVELKKTFGGKTETKEDECVIDTTPVNFKELTKAFGQDVHLRSKPKRTVISRRSDPFNIHQGNQTDSSKQNGHINVDKVNYTDQSLANQINGRPKRFTSVVGIQPHNQGQSFGFRNGVKTTQTMPVVKGFKIQAQNGTVQNGSFKEFPKESSNNCPQPPKPPTMPVITGVTLKNTNARPKSMPVQLDARDTLLESIRNFGGRENLKNAAERR